MELYFRIKDKGADVFRIADRNPHNRLELAIVAEANVKNGKINPRRNARLTDDETRRIRAWIDARAGNVAAQEATLAHRTVERLNRTAHWFGNKPEAEAADPLADDLLLAMHDLRTAILRYKSKRRDPGAKRR